MKAPAAVHVRVTHARVVVFAGLVGTTLLEYVLQNKVGALCCGMLTNIVWLFMSD